MKSANIAELKAHLSRYVKLVKKGQRVLVLERNTPVAELVPYQPPPQEILQRLVAEGRCKAPTLKSSEIHFTPLEAPMTTHEIDELIVAVKGDH